MLNDDVLKMAMLCAAVIIFLEQFLGFYPFGADPRADKSPAFNEGENITGVPEVVGDEHIRYYRGRNLVDSNWFHQPTSRTPK